MYARAERFLADCLTLSEGHRHLEIKGYTLSQLGNIAMFRGDFRQARAYYHESLAAFEADGEEDDLACVAYQSLGRFLVLEQDFVSAIPLLEKGLVIRRRRQEQEGIANNAINLALAYLGCDRLEEAEPLLDEALAISKELYDQRAIVLCHLAFGRLAGKRGDRAGAILQYRQALEILAQMPMPPLELQVLAELLPQLLRAGQMQALLFALARLFKNLHQQRLGLLAIWRLLKRRIENYLRLLFREFVSLVFGLRQR